MRLLLVEDDIELTDTLHKALISKGFAVDVVHNGVDAEFMGDEESYDLVILDLGLPQRSGLEVLTNWRTKGNTLPVIILTARDSWHERIDGFKAGADDYLGKPFHVEELVMRIQALLRRTHDKAGQALECQGLKLDEETQQLIIDGKVELLTGTEFRLLRYFMLNAGKVLSKTRLIEHVYEQDFDKDSNLIEVYIRRLRDKLGKERIVTRRGQGYIFMDSLS
ncbi:response regulator transcription factor [sulfur-oxidizing endosymbiont of Gigantopelta aegis]|uniref:response regulator transcription factor n=1 Tax=sulfur-oxidizing endosymbiont of Gigantopelta aegis TaxID=2794934 RepID=UPI0018DD62E3|nr:response regulator transcription factor [sulfur-oxidizing endosymbiont of Gigantopelta aegis]